MTLVDHTFSKWGSFTGAKGTVEYVFSTPSGYQFKNATLDVHEGGAEIRKIPETGAVGSLVLSVRWWYGMFEKARYTVKAHAEEIPVPDEAQPRQKVLIRQKLHEGEWFGDNGVDNHSVSIPEGYALQRTELFIRRTGGLQGSAQRNDTPPKGSTGDLPFSVSWSYPPLGKIDYRLYIYAVEGAEHSLDITSVDWAPDPAEAGRDISLTIVVRNTGVQSLGNVQFSASIYAIDLVDDTYNLIEHLSDNQRTQNVYTGTRSLNIAPRETKSVNIDTHIAGQATSIWSTAGLYRVTIVADLGSIVIGSLTIEGFEVVKT